MTAPALIAVAHGTRQAAGQAEVRGLVSAVRQRRPDLEVRLAYLDLERPRLRAVATTLDRPAVAVPLLFTRGYHVGTDIPEAVHGTPVTVAPPLAPDPALTVALNARLREAGGLDADAIVLASAGSSDPGAAPDVHRVADHLAAMVGRPVLPGYASAAHPRVDEAVVRLREAGAGRVAVAAMLLADGHFHRSLATSGADVVSRPLGRHPEVVGLILSRHQQTCR
ncbi:MAG TPA: CbiX/SirB N-terminal domain-containing protein [Micromonosporaceae bacterium]|nr:CbiX/SirB N-terminal domain-containing protein [Micromonosporaceae bacterium]